MNYRAVGSAALAVLAVLALAGAAATLPTPIQPAVDEGTGAGDAEGVGPGSGGGVGATEGGMERPSWLSALAAFLFTLLRLLALLATLLFLAVLITNREEVLAALRDALGRLPRTIALAVALLLVGSGYLAVLAWVSDESGIPRAAPLPPLPGGGGGTSQSTPAVLPSVVPLVIVLAVVVGALVAFWRYREADPDAEPDSTPEPEAEPDRAADVGRAAGRAADRIEDDDAVENAVFRAWREMTALLDGDRRTTTPREFARRATAAGLDPDDVARLTRLFEDVRYGNAGVTPERERSAQETLRRIEAAYADDRGQE